MNQNMLPINQHNQLSSSKISSKLITGLEIKKLPYKTLWVSL
jgi:hypothetical protein